MVFIIKIPAVQLGMAFTMEMDPKGYWKILTKQKWEWDLPTFIYLPLVQNRHSSSEHDCYFLLLLSILKRYAINYIPPPICIASLCIEMIGVE